MFSFFPPGFVSCQDDDLSESEESFESEFNIKYHSKEEEKRAGKIYITFFIIQFNIKYHSKEEEKRAGQIIEDKIQIIDLI